MTKSQFKKKWESKKKQYGYTDPLFNFVVDEIPKLRKAGVTIKEISEVTGYCLGKVNCWIIYGPDMPSPVNKEVARNRDGNRCRMCGNPPKNNRRLDVHHIFSGRDHSVGNFLTVCHDCHVTLHKIKKEKPSVYADGMKEMMRQIIS